MDDTVREMRKKEACRRNVERVGAVPARGRMRARVDVRAAARGHTSAVYAFAVTGTGLMRL